MKRAIGILLVLAMLAALACTALGEEPQGRTMYVYTKNGKTLSIRSSMSTKDDSNIIGHYKYGDKVICYGSPQNGWVYVDSPLGYGDAYVMSRYLVSEKPAPFKKDGSSGTSTSSSSSSTAESTTVSQMNALVAAPKFVEPYEVTVRPTRASGWVYMRWFPSKNAEKVATFAANKKLTVIAELKDWYQVVDPETEKTGFVYKSYIQ